MEQAVFIILALGAILSAIAVVTPFITRTPVHSALALVVCFLFVAGLYASLAAHVLAVLQVMVYAGAIMVLFLFVLMLLNLGEERRIPWRISGTKGLGALLVLFVAGKLYLVLTAADALVEPADLTAPAMEEFGSLGAVADELFHRFLLPFELLSLLLLVALTGALVLAKKRLDLPAPPDAPPADGEEHAA